MAKKKLLFIFVILIVFVGCDVPTTKNASLEPVVSETTVKQEAKQEVKPIVVKAEDVIAAFEDNELKGNQLYKGKVAEISGVVLDISEALGSTYINLKSGKEYDFVSMQCFFKKQTEIDKLANLQKGQKLTVVGTIDGLSMNVIVNDCKLK